MDARIFSGSIPMASIVFRKGRNRPWRAQIKKKGHKTFNKSFAQKKDAQRWAAEQERTIDLTGLPLTVEQLKKTTVGDLIDRYLKEVTPQKASAENEKLVLEKFKRNPMCKKSLAELSSGDGAKYRDERLKDTWKPKGSKGPAKPIKPSTVRREVNTLHHIFEVARTEWDFTNLINPFDGLKIKLKTPGLLPRRKRRLKPGEHKFLDKAADDCRGENMLYGPLAIALAIETGMRLQEIFNLTWEDINTRTRRINIQKSKTDHVTDLNGREIVMTKRAAFLFLVAMPHNPKPARIPTTKTAAFLFFADMPRNKKLNPDQKVFPMSKGAFKQAWKGVVKRAGVEGLTFHDLRREASSRFDAAGLTKGEHDLMMGHDTGDMASLYIHADLNRIQEKLDEYEKDKFPFHVETMNMDSPLV